MKGAPWRNENLDGVTAILVLEDDSDLRSLLVQFLCDNRYDATGASSGPEAIALATKKKVSLLVADVRMEGMDGLECLAALRTAQPDLRSIIMTGYASEDAPGRAVELGADDYVYKPFKMRDLLTSVNRVLERVREREGYSGLLRRIFRRASPPPAIGLQELYDLAIQSFFVGVRSRKLRRNEALSIWDELERILGSDNTDEDRCQAYRCLIERMAALSRNEMGAPRRSWGIDPERFARFYDRLQRGEISVELLRIAPQLRDMRPEELAEDPALADLYRKTWS